MEAYIDDSMTDGHVLVFGGLLAPAESWEAFSINWQQCLEHRALGCVQNEQSCSPLQRQEA